jgi:protein-S-isoprenylcysteine O-methyltransferase Ste14
MYAPAATRLCMSGPTVSDLARRTVFGFVQLLVVLGVVLFALAGTLDYVQAWVYLLIFFLSAALITIYLWRKDPRLLERRVNAGPVAEKEPIQKVIQLLAALAFIGIFVICALDHRLVWSTVPLAIVIVGDVLVALGFVIVFLVFKENSFTAATIEVAADQRVISSGPYAIVRHPMYAGALIMLIGTPLALGSWWALLAFIPMAIVIAVRLLDEEQFLSQHLPGYTQYCQNVRSRLIPSIL